LKELNRRKTEFNDHWRKICNGIKGWILDDFMNFQTPKLKESKHFEISTYHGFHISWNWKTWIKKCTKKDNHEVQIYGCGFWGIFHQAEKELKMNVKL
jgi:hypothetical protein